MHGVVWIEHICRIRSARAVAAQLCVCAACFNLHLLAAAVVSCMYTLKFDLKSYIKVKWIGLKMDRFDARFDEHWHLACRTRGGAILHVPAPPRRWVPPLPPGRRGTSRGAQAPTAARLCGLYGLLRTGRGRGSWATAPRPGYL